MTQQLSDERVAEAGAGERAIRAEQRVAALEAALREERARRDAAEAALAALAKRDGLVFDGRAATTLESLAESVAPASVSLFPETLAGLIGAMRSATRIRADNGRLRALLRQWVTWSVTEPHGYLCRCGAYGDTVQSAPHAPECVVGDTLKELEACE